MPTRKPRCKNKAMHNPSDFDIMRRLLAKLQRGGDVRIRQIMCVRDSIQSCAYENDLKLHVAADRLLDVLERR